MEKRELIINKLRAKGFRITKQRLIVLDVLLEGDCSSSKEILYKSLKKDSAIGAATVYRMLNTLEEMGYIVRKELSNKVDFENDEQNDTYIIEFEDSTLLKLSASKWNQIVKMGLDACGYGSQKAVKNIRFGS